MSRPRAGDPRAAAAIWDPVPEPRHARQAAEARRARRRGRLQACVAGGCAAALYAFWTPGPALVAAGVAALLLATSQLSPGGAYAGIERAFAALGRWTGELLSLVSLALVFGAIFLPFGLLFRRGARDPLKRRHAPDADSYWHVREPARPDAPRRQF